MGRFSRVCFHTAHTHRHRHEQQTVSNATTHGGERWAVVRDWRSVSAVRSMPFSSVNSSYSVCHTHKQREEQPTSKPSAEAKPKPKPHNGVTARHTDRYGKRIKL